MDANYSQPQRYQRYRSLQPAPHPDSPDAIIAEKNEEIRRLKEQITELESIQKATDVFAAVGSEVRGCKLEREKGAQADRGLVADGNEACVFGNALADAMLYQNCMDKIRTDIDHYISVYAFHPNFIVASKECTRFLDVVTWRATTKLFYDQPYNQIRFRSTDIAHIIPKLLAEQPDWSGEDFERFFHSAGRGRNIYTELKRQYDWDLKRYRRYVNRKKGFWGGVAKVAEFMSR